MKKTNFKPTYFQKNSGSPQGGNRTPYTLSDAQLKQAGAPKK